MNHPQDLTAPREEPLQPVTERHPWKGNLAKDLQLPLTMVFIVLGVALATQLRTQQIIRNSAAEDRVEVLAEKLREANRKSLLLEQEVDNLRKKITGYEGAAAQQSSLVAKMNAELQETKASAGLVPLQGPGIEVQLEDSRIRASSVEQQEAYVVHDIDILQLVNELKAASAEAIAVNGQRIVAMSEIRCVGPTIRVNGTSVASPFKVDAIGNPSTLKGALEMPMGILETLQALKIRVKVVKKDSLIIPAAPTGPTSKFGKPVLPTNSSKGENSP